MPINIQSLIDAVVRSVRIEMADEFDRNFERQGFFSEKWKRNYAGTHVLVQSGSLRRSILNRQEGDTIVFSSDLPYAEIHNEGGRIRVTAKMKKFFWAKSMEAQGSMGRKKDGTKRNDKRNAQLNAKAEFWKRMALMKVGKEIESQRKERPLRWFMVL